MILLARPGRLRDLLARHGGVIDETLDRDLPIARVGPSDGKDDVDLAPVLHDRGAARLTTPARVLLVSARISGRVDPGRRWVHAHAERVLAELLEDELPRFVDHVPPGVHCEPGARIALGAIVGEGSRIGAGAVVYPHARLGRGVVIGAGSVVGAQGFGFVDGEHGPIRMPHRAGVVLEDDVELGALCTVDAGILVPTRIGAETKLDAQVHVGHGVIVGARCRFAAQVGLAGSVVVEDEVFIGGQAGIADHVRIGKGARIAAKSGVIGDVAPGETVAGYPAVPRARWLRGHARLYRGRP